MAKCKATGCTVTVHPRFLMCMYHWRCLTPYLRGLIYRTYKPAEGKHYCDEPAYQEAVQQAIKHIAVLEEQGVI